MLNSFHFFEPEDTPPNIHIGLRMIKTAVAVFICSVIGYFLNISALFSMAAAVICVQNNAEKSVYSALNRILGTLIGGAFGVALRYAGVWTGLYNILPLYYFAVSLLIIPVMLITLVIRKPSISAFSCIVFISVAVTAATEKSPLESSLLRIIDTLIGIAAALAVNLALPKRQLGIKEKSTTDPEFMDDVSVNEQDKSNEQKNIIQP